jgi:acetyl-CoA carboxylase carboxyltransferase component
VPIFVVLRLHDSFLENHETVSLSLENSTIGIMEPHQKVYRNRKKTKKKKKKKKRKRKKEKKKKHSMITYFFTHSSVSLLRQTLFEFS